MNRTTQSRNAYMRSLGDLQTSRKERLESTPLTAEDLFGPQMRRLKDSAKAGNNATKQALARSAMASGGDVTGKNATIMLQGDAQTNQTLGDIESNYAEKTIALNERDKDRTLQELGLLLQGQGNAWGNDQTQDNFDRQLNLQRKQANRQFWADILGSVAGTTASIFAPGLGKAGAATTTTATGG